MLNWKIKLRSIFNDKADLVLATIITCSVLSTSKFAIYLFPKNINLTIWVVFFSLFLSYFRFGATKIKQIKYVAAYSLLTLAILTIAELISLTPNPYYIILRALLIFICLCLPRYLPGGKSVSIFIVVYTLLLFSLNHENMLFNEFSVSLFNFIFGLIIAIIFTTVFILLIPIAKIQIAPINKDIIIIRQAIRITITINSSLFIANIFNLNNPLWICLASLVISQAHFGLSVKKALERLIGTILGAICGTIIANILFKNYPETLYLSLIIIFLTFYFSRRYYTLAIILATILLTASFYLLKPNLSINEFILARILDTFLGVSIGLLAEIFIFPQSLMQLIRLNLRQIFQNMYDIFELLANQVNSELINSKIAMLEVLRHELTLNIKIVHYELITHISKRYSYIHHIYIKTGNMYLDIKQLTEIDTTLVNQYVFKQLAFGIKELNLLSKHSDPHVLDAVLSKLKQSLIEINCYDDEVIKQVLCNVTLHLIELIELYQIILLTPYWLPNWIINKNSQLK